ncbi:PHOTOTROPIC-RESPONSIVE NPH3 FAMILY PROTEIN [Salix purpurea]|uniref:PHOTOTROPIC-RESPONSIVE NPH3 FAMILY PROTEIN n=1 Tax=Salix purpurea TaxID=77065 RepID=A0A9Q0WMM6_SALPP|nr:PHOTOTROPIC-RESPONSIVE NPH3 FAMILY PROTEIN [Salix purpurea]
MEVGSTLEVDVNGEEIFMVDKWWFLQWIAAIFNAWSCALSYYQFLGKILSSFSARLGKLFGNLASSSRKLKVIFDNFPGGSHVFELMARFCYSNGTIEITPSNVVLLNCAAHYMEIGSNGPEKPNLVDQTEKFLEGINYWTWTELLRALKQCQNLLPATISSFFLEKVLDCLVGRLTLPTLASPFTCSSNNSQFSCDTSSTCSTRNNWSQTTWWFEDLLVLNANSFDKECKITEVSINLLSLLDRSSLSCKGLFDILLAARLKALNKFYKLKLEHLIGSMLDQSTLDHLLVPSPHRNHHVYDVDLVLRLAKAFLLEGSKISRNQLGKVASLMDSYLIEVAPDFFLKPSKFAALVMVLPDSARESSDRLYQAIDIYLQVHVQLSEEEKVSLWSVVNRDKLSAEALEHLARHSNFPSRKTLQSLITQQSKINISIHNHFSYHKDSSQSTFHMDAKEEQEDVEQILIYARRRRHSKKIDNLETESQGMQKRVAEWEKVCAMVRSEKIIVTKPSLHGPGKARSLPKLCS